MASTPLLGHLPVLLRFLRELGLDNKTVRQFMSVWFRFRDERTVGLVKLKSKSLLVQRLGKLNNWPRAIAIVKNQDQPGDFLELSPFLFYFLFFLNYFFSCSLVSHLQLFLKETVLISFFSFYLLTFLLTGQRLQ